MIPMQPSAPRANPYAVPALNGITNPPGVSYFDKDHTYPYDVTLTASQALTGQVVPIDTDADFIWRGYQLTTNTGAFTYRFADASLNYLSSGLLSYLNLLVDGVKVKSALSKEIVIPAGGTITIDITDVSVATNTIEIVFIGVKRYRLPGGTAPR